MLKRKFNDKELELLKNVSLKSNDICDIFNVHWMTIWRWRRDLGIKMTTGSNKLRPSRLRRETRICKRKDCHITFTIIKSRTKQYCSHSCHSKISSKKPRKPRKPRNSNIDEYTRYKRKVYRMSQKTYQANINIINPHRYLRTLCGVIGGWQLDHIATIRECFDQGISEEKVASLTNLRMLPWKDNLKRNRKK